jgi:hypothetical protein
VPIGILLALVAVCCVQATTAQVSIFWRAAVFSWDSPTSQLQDELAVSGTVYVDGARQLREHAGAALASSERLSLPGEPVHRDGVALSSRLTRSPPPA